MNIRPITPDDRGAFDAFLADLSGEDLARRFGRAVSRQHPAVQRYLFGPANPGCVILGAFDVNGELMGSANLCVAEGGAGEVAVAVRRAARLRSVGRALLHRLLQDARARGASRLLASVMVENAAALALALHMGFRVVERSPGTVWLELWL